MFNFLFLSLSFLGLLKDPGIPEFLESANYHSKEEEDPVSIYTHGNLIKTLNMLSVL
jgi:hypothetical protein